MQIDLVIEFKNVAYDVQIELKGSGLYSASVLSLPGCKGMGTDKDDLVSFCRNLIRKHIASQKSEQPEVVFTKYGYKYRYIVNR